MAYAYRIRRSTVSQIVSKTCDALWSLTGWTISVLRRKLEKSSCWIWQL